MKHEQAVADAFNRFLLRKGAALGRPVRTLTLDGQDRDAGDYLLTDENRYALVEFKYMESDIGSEKIKDRRLKLCKLLEDDVQMTKLHDQCHFIAWKQRPQSGVQLNIYRHEVCNRQIFGPKCDLECVLPFIDSRVLAEQFADQFFASTESRTLSIDNFESYLYWLMSKASESNRSTLEILVDDENSKECAIVEFNSVRDVHNWFVSRRESKD